MAMRTIECALSAPEETRKRLWAWAEKYTLLVNELLEKVQKDPRFSQWQSRGQVPATLIDKEWITPIKKGTEYSDLPNQFFVSARHTVSQVYKSWFAQQQKSFHRLQNKQKWLDSVKPVLKMAESGLTHDEICIRASQWLKLLEVQAIQAQPEHFSQFGALIRAAKQPLEPIDQLAIAYLLLNRLTIPEKPLDMEKIRHRLTKKKIEIQRLQAKVDAKLPKGRDLTGEKYLKRLEQAIALPTGLGGEETLAEELTQWNKQVQIPSYSPLPYPLKITANDRLQLRQIQTEKGERLEVVFSGLNKCTFKIQCGRRQLHIFRQLQAEPEYIKLKEKDNRKNPKIIPPSKGLLPLRSAQLIWRPSRRHQKEKSPWIRYRLYLHCNIDDRLLSHEGTLKVSKERMEDAQQQLKNYQQASSEKLTKTQQNYKQRTQSQLLRLQTVSLKRPHVQPYIGNPDLVLQVKLDLALPLQASIVNTVTQQCLGSITATQLLHRPRSGSNGHDLKQLNHLAKQILRLHQKRVTWQIISQQAQSKGKILRSRKRENLGIYTDRLIAKRLIEWSIKHEVSCLVLPIAKGLTERIEADLQAAAQLKFPHYKKLQLQYAQAIRDKYPYWSYSRLIEAIVACANRHGLNVQYM